MRSSSGKAIITAELHQILEQLAESSIFYKLLQQNSGDKARKKTDICEKNYLIVSAALLMKSFCSHVDEPQLAKKFTNFLENYFLSWLEGLLKNEKGLETLNFSLGKKNQTEYLSANLFQADNPLTALINEEDLILLIKNITNLFYEMIINKEFSSNMKENINQHLEICFFDKADKSTNLPLFEKGLCFELNNYSNMEQLDFDKTKGKFQGTAILITSVS